MLMLTGSYMATLAQVDFFVAAVLSRQSLIGIGLRQAI